MVAHAFSPSTREAKGRWISEFQASLVYKVSSRTARAIQRTLSRKTKQSKKKKHKKDIPFLLQDNLWTMYFPTASPIPVIRKAGEGTVA